ncbi:class I SAM-dependent methyltransferase [Kribbella capetownensis]|uniref:Class I SAM-dependent methyltransferase n=1 Tax=Kribbella capetownensis TaxID=1572659 RepID=A0A4V2M7I3_9ACTN|nr:class I SAM-dependent methyltransferase [Kribbella capetownensis]TCC47792.1 class I SAM-dependent methyltransferase [Kribbella capetownensis]
MAESFGVDAERYDRVRPRYPDALIRTLVEASPGNRVLDVGCGTGIVSRQLQAAGCEVLGVDVDERMAEFARRTGVEVEVSPFESWDPHGRTFDAVVAGMTWHWIDPVAGAAKAAEVLAPGGRLAVFWNVFQPPSDLAEAFAAVYREVLPDRPMYHRVPASPLEAYLAFLGKAADGMRESGAFDEPERWQFPWSRPYSRDEWIEQMRTGGDASHFDPSKFDELLTGIGAAVDAAGGSFQMDFTALTLTATRR